MMKVQLYCACAHGGSVTMYIILHDEMAALDSPLAYTDCIEVSNS